MVSGLFCSVQSARRRTSYAASYVLCNSGVEDESTSVYLLLFAGRNAGRINKQLIKMVASKEWEVEGKRMEGGSKTYLS